MRRPNFVLVPAVLAGALMLLPSSARAQSEPSGGGDTAQPSGGGDTAQPSGGGDTAQPSGGSDTAPPPAASTAPASSGASYLKTPHTGRRPFHLDIHAGVAWYGWGLATGVRFGIPLVKNGFIRTLNNAIYLNFGADVYYVNDWDPNNHWWRYGVGLGFPVTFHWEFYFTRRWSAFGEVGVNVFLPPSLLRGDRWYLHYWGDWVIAQAGGRFHINKHMTLTLRVGNPYTSFGISFLL